MFHDRASWRVYRFVTVFRWLCLVVAAGVIPSGAAPSDLLKSVEDRYNNVKTLRVNFTEIYRAYGRAVRESGVLYLQKPGRMRWEYAKPAGKQFVSDGKHFYLYSPIDNRAQKVPVKESSDMRAPLGFLLGRLDFRKDFRRFETRPEGENTYIIATPKSDNLPYTQVEFVVTPDAQIRRLLVIGQDQSVMDFSFSDEQINPRLDPEKLEFKPPPGVPVVETEG